VSAEAVCFKAFGKNITIPIKQIASVDTTTPGMQSIKIETTGGKKYKLVVRLRDKRKLIDAINQAISAA